MSASQTPVQEDLLTFAKDGHAEIAALKVAAEEAARAVEARERSLRNELIQRLRGKTVRVTGSTVTEEFYGQGGWEFDRSRVWLNDELVVIGSIHVDDDRYSLEKEPLVYAKYVNGNMGRGLSFLLLQMRTLEIVGP